MTLTAQPSEKRYLERRRAGGGVVTTTAYGPLKGTCYRHTSEATMLKVMTSPTKLVSRRTAGMVEKL